MTEELQRIADKIIRLKGINKRKWIIDTYMRAVMKFQKWMLHFHYLRNTMIMKAKNERSKEDSILINFSINHWKIAPEMRFYKISNLPWIQGFDLISSFILKFKYWGIEFLDLPIIYKSIFEKVEIWMMWYDEKLKESLLEYYADNIEMLQLKQEYIKLTILPTSLLYDQKFKEIIKHQESFRLNTTKWRTKKSDLISKEFWDILFDTRLHVSDNRLFSRLKYKLTWFDPELEKELKHDIAQCDKILDDYMGYELIVWK